ncbi:amino acid adenylation domain-containing protein [Streptomyces sp. NPDC054940]
MNEELPESGGGFYEFPASRAQQRMYFLQQLLGDAPTYHMPLFFLLRGSLESEALRTAARALVERHEALRTRFTVRDGELLQLISPTVEFEWREIDARSSAEPETDAREWIDAEACRPFDLERGPLLRVGVYRKSQSETILLLGMHHIVSDGWSCEILLRELSACYDAAVHGREIALPEPEFQYADYSSWQDEWLESPAAHRQKEYWRQQLAGELPVLRLPMTRRGADVGPGDGSHAFRLPEDAAERLRALCTESNATFFMGLLAAFQVLLHRYTGLDDILVGTPIAGRSRSEFDGSVGLFINTTVLRADLTGDPGFRALLAQVRDTVLGAQDHQDIPFEELVRMKNPDREAGTSPLFQVMFGMNETGDQGLLLPGITTEWLPVEFGAAKFDLLLDVADAPGGPEAVFEYRDDLLDPSAVGAMAQNFGRLVRSIAADPDAPLSRLRLLPEEDYARLAPPSASASASASVELPPVHERFASWAARTPDAVALVDGERRIGYAELDRSANRLAHRLRKLGVGPGTFVGLSMERSAELVIAILGIAKAGGCYVPLDPAYPQDRLRYIVEDTGLETIVVGGAVPHWWTGFGGTVLDLTAPESEWAGLADGPVDSGAGPDDLAYVIYTSGSTGRPKGVLIPHRNVSRLFTATDPWFGFGEQDVWAMFHSYAFDFSVWELWGALAHGGRLVMVPYAVSRDPRAFRRLVAEQGVTVLNQTPSAFHQFIRADLAEDDGGAPLSLRHVIFGGEALEPSGLRAWFDRHGDSSPQLINMYGITETTVHVTYRPITAKDMENGGGSVIGVPIPDLRLYVLDRQGRPVPEGVPGELYVGGRGLAVGYLNRPELTAERFVPHPYGSGQDRLYRTGDLVRVLPDGDLEYCGRIDSQIQLRGFRVELGEIEAALTGHERVDEAIVLLRTGEQDHAELAAYVTARGADLDAAVLRAHVARLLPDHMIPSTFTVLPEFPLTANGKVDRRNLPDPGRSRAGTGSSFVAPRTGAERALAGVWAKVLGLGEVGIDDNYFSLGGDSIRSIQLVGLAREAGLTISFNDLMRHQTVRELAQVAGRDEPADAPLSVPFALVSAADAALLPEEVEDAYPMTRLQSGMIFHSDLSEGPGEYHNVATYRIRAEFSAEAWQSAVAELLARHEVLRTSFDLHRYQEPLQLVHRSVPLPLTFEDLRPLGADARTAAADARFAEESARAFDWRAGPLIRFHVQRFADDTQQLFITEHHAILDGWSERSLFTELLAGYARLLAEPGSAAEPAPRARFSSYVRMEREALDSPESRRFWNELLDGAEFAGLPRALPAADGPAPARMRTSDRPVAADVQRGLDALARDLGVPLRTVLLGAHLRVMSLLSGTGDVVTGAVYNGRTEEKDGDRVLGLFLNTVPVRAGLTGGTWSDLVRETAALDLEIQRHRRYPLAEIMRQTGSPELFETFFNYTHFHVEQSLGEVSAVEVLDQDGVADTNFPFGAEFFRDSVDGALGLGLRFDAARFDEAQIGRAHGYYAAVLRAMATSPQGRYETADLLSAAEHRTFDAWNRTETAYDRPHVLHALIEEQVRRTPEATAVRFEGRSLSYRELDERADRLAHLLTERGARRGDFVAVLLERSLELPVCLLAVLKAGAAYVPLDPEHPARRLCGILADSGIRLAISTEPWAERIATPDVSIVRPDEAEDPSYRCPEGAPAESAVGPDDRAYMIFTSGSTGTPKGVVISHRAIVNRLLWMQQEYGLRPGERVLQKTPYTFDVSVWEFFWPLLTGSVLVLAAPGGHRDSGYLARLIRQEEITTVHFVPSMLQAFVEDPATAACTGLRRVMCSGEALPYDLQQRFLRKYPAELHNLYGPTEAAVDVTYWKCVEDGRALVPIGRPIANTELYVLDRHGFRAPLGVTGELYLGGVGLAEGYHRQPEATERSFVRHTDHTGTTRRLYRTGDLVRYLPDGVLEYRGRTDSQVKLRGFRIELGEIESVLGGHPAVAECAVLLRDERLVAFLVPAAGAEVRPADLAEYVGSRLPSYMVPSAWATLAEMPLSPNGKLDRKRLPEQVRPELDGERPAVAPRDAYEERLLALWAGVLGREAGIHDDFFQIGGHSLAALRLVSRINSVYDRDFGVSVVLENETVAKQAALVRGDVTPRARPGAAVPIRGGGGERPLFLVHPVGGGVLCYREPAAAFGPGLPVFGLPAPGLVPGEEPLRTVAELADSHLRAVRAVQDSGPYRLGGWSFGGLVAYEMACRLVAEGEVVELLAMVDSAFPGSDGDSSAPAEPVDRALREEFAEDLLRSGQDTDGDLDGEELARHYEVFRTNLLAAETYRPPVYPGAVRFYQSRDGARLGAADGWAQRINGGLTVRDIETDHYRIVRSPQFQEIAKDMEATMQERHAR